MLNNLVSNAIKFCESGSILITARYVRPPGCSSSSGGGGSVAVAVQDTGLGIPQHKLNTIFQPFEQVCAAACSTVVTWLFPAALHACAFVRAA